VILAIVGTRLFGSEKGLVYARLVIEYEVTDFMHWTGFVTGDPQYSNSHGVDALVKQECNYQGRECEVLAPVNRRWEPDGFKARNIAIAEACDELLCIRNPESSSYGSGWTANYAETLGKKVTRVEIS